MIDINKDKEMEIWLDSQSQRECPQCGGTDIEPMYWWKNGIRQDYIGGHCEECNFTVEAIQTKEAVIL